MNRSEQIGELVAALAKAQSEFTPALKDSDNPFYQSKYADLAAVINAVRPALSKNGIAMVHSLESDLERQCAIVTVGLYHGEQFLEVTVEAPATGRAKKEERNEGAAATKFDVQTIGAAWSYLRRYTLQAICGLASEDDDGNSLQGDNKPIVKRKPADPPQDGKFLLTGDLLACVVKGITEKTAKSGNPYLTVTLNGRVDGFNYAFCYHKSLFPAINSALDKEINLQLKANLAEDGKSVKFYTIEDVPWAAGIDYVEGKAAGGICG